MTFHTKTNFLVLAAAVLLFTRDTVKAYFDLTIMHRHAAGQYGGLYTQAWVITSIHQKPL